MGEPDSRLAAELAGQADRIAALEARLDELEQRVAASRSARIDERAAFPRDRQITHPTAAPNPWTVGLPALAGRTIMVLGGAFFLRAITDSGALPASAGVAVGIAYALVWVTFVDRAARAGRAPDATAHGLATTIIAFPLIWETTTRFGLLSPITSAVTLTSVASVVLAVAWWRRLGLLAWIVTLASTMTGVALLFATKSLPLFSLSLFVLAVASLAASFHRKWYGLRWPAAIALDLLVILAMYLIGKTNYEWLRAHEVAIVQLLMTATYLGIIGVRTIVLGHPTREFGIVQSLLVLVIGFEGARRVLGLEHAWTGAFAPVALVLAIASYVAAFARFERDPNQRANWTWYLSLGTILVLYSAALLIPGYLVGLPWATVALVGAYLGRRDDRSAVRWNVMALVSAAAFGSGIVNGAYRAFLAADASQPMQIPTPAWGAAAFSLAAWILLRWPSEVPEVARDRTLPGLALLVIGATGLGSGLVAMLGPAVSGIGTDAADPGLLAVLRTAILCAAGLGFAGLSRIRRHPELVWAAYGALAAAALKIAVDDLPNGRPMTMFLSFILFGGTMIVAPRLVPDAERTT